MSDEDLTAILARTGKRKRARSTTVLIAVLLVLCGAFGAPESPTKYQASGVSSGSRGRFWSIVQVGVPLSHN